MWTKELTVKGVTASHKIIYIKHTATGHVITSQYKAWNDSIRMCMWFELVIKPIYTRSQNKMLLWCDNCGSHKTGCVMQTINEIGLDIAFLPKNMTGELQVLDLVVNGPLKAHIRKNRAGVLYDSFQDYKVERAEDSQLPVEQRKNLDFDPPKPTLVGGLKDMFQLFADGFTETKFMECITRTFIKTGTLPIATRCEKRHRTGVVYGRREESRYTTPPYFRLFHATSLRGCGRVGDRTRGTL